MPEINSNIERVPIGISKNGFSVWYSKASSHAATQINDTPRLEALVIEITKNIELDGGYMQFHTDMGRVIGRPDLVKIELGDNIVYAKRLNRDSYFT